MAGHDLSGIIYTGDKDHSQDRITLVISKWNKEITYALAEGATGVLARAGVPRENITRFEVPGSFELPFGAQVAMSSSNPPDAVICLGCVIQGETRHFEFINQAVAQGVTRVGLDYNVPVIFGVLTPDTEQQALDRAGGKYGNKGDEAAVAALELIDLKRSV